MQRLRHQADQRNRAPDQAAQLSRELRRAMQQNNDGHPYVEKIREETQAYVRKPIAENESLRVVVAELEARNARLERDLTTAQSEITLHQKQELLLHEKVQDIRS